MTTPVRCRVLQQAQGRHSDGVVSLPSCHTWFSEENQMHLICAPGSSLHTYDRRHEWIINKQQ
jgi:hypothetical protein